VWNGQFYEEMGKVVFLEKKRNKGGMIVIG
jgi:hypothetical protein